MPPAVSPRRRFPLAALGLAALAAVFALGIVHLFQLRFSLGDVYPPYSTLRTDPLGAKAIYEALAAQPGLTVERNLRPLDQLDRPAFGASGSGDDDASPPPLTCFYLGADTYEWPFLLEPDAVERLETIMRRGGRVVLTFLPAATPLTAERLETLRREAGSPAASPEPAANDQHASPRPRASPAPSSTPRLPRRDAPAERPDLILRWNLDFRRRDPGDKGKNSPNARLPAPTAANHAHAAPADGVPILDPVPLSWHSVTDFDLTGGAGWRALYTCEGRPVIVARPFGFRGGELILCGDSYFLSNEALRAEPHSPLLTALVGPARRVIFDESHLGISEHPGLVTLARRYRLQGALLALGLLAALFVWRNVVSLVPPLPAAPDGADPGGGPSAVLGRDSAAGFLNLLRRGVPARDLPAVCLAQWEQADRGASAHAPTLERLRAVVQADAARPARQRSVAATYRAMCGAARKKR